MGINGKSGLKASEVEVCLDNIKALGVDHVEWPVHLTLGKVLGYSSRQSPMDELMSVGLVGSAYLVTAAELGQLAWGLRPTPLSFFKRIIKATIDLKTMLIRKGALYMGLTKMIESNFTARH